MVVCKVVLWWLTAEFTQRVKSISITTFTFGKLGPHGFCISLCWKIGKTTWCFHKLWILTIEQRFTIMKKEQLIAIRQKPTCGPSMSSTSRWTPVDQTMIELHTGHLLSAMTGFIADPEVTHCCFTWSRRHKLLTVITLNSFNGKSNSEMSWSHLSLTDLWAHCVLIWVNNQISFPRIFL